MKRATMRLAALSALLAGAHAAGGGRTIHVDAIKAGPFVDGESWCTAYSSLQRALAVAGSGDIIKVADGIYRPDEGPGVTPGDRLATFQLLSGVTVEGGYAGCGAAEPDARDLFLYETILSGDLAGDDRDGFVNTSDNSYHVVLTAGVGPASRLDGVTITGGNADGDDPHARGGGLFNEGGSPTIRSCTFRANRATLGGAINNEDGNPIIEHCVFDGNRAGFSGGAIRGWNSDPTVHNCLFVNNTADAGGAAWFGASTPSFDNCTAYGNTAPAGNAFSFGSCCPEQPSTFVAANCVLWDGGDEVFNDDDSAISIIFSVVQDGWAGEGNVSDAPLFVPGPAGCYYLSHLASGQSANSPCVNAGDRTALVAGLDTRTTRSDETWDAGIVDMGYHYPVTNRQRVAGDFDLDQRVDLRDAAALQRCFTDAGPTDVSPGCRIFDVALDADVDLDDIPSFTQALSGP